MNEPSTINTIFLVKIVEMSLRFQYSKIWDYNVTLFIAIVCIYTSYNYLSTH